MNLEKIKLEGVEVIWRVNDGYAGKDRPHKTTIAPEDFEDCETEEEAQAIIEDWVQTEFNLNITFSWEIKE